ncbi:sensor histidine kinase [Tengunoibacter tsumagoiensis]|uniref:histidine kinase n=1 Tax=Tengunoibacter tsumagoiensis TaxID=2014871 RepID=A0A402A4E8_9CHLR|nr:ATP-binding protein [Tengunoibacter tsumagoiensis]GCE13881.1 two-component sensor histidine kinase [Tengunoibacter tsumagoiensis]
MTSRLKRSWPPGIRYQLAIWYTTVFVALLLCTGLFLYKQLENSLLNSLDTELAQTTNQLLDDITYDNGTITVHDELNNLSRSDLLPLNNDHQFVTIQNSLIIRVLDTRGHVLRTSLAFNHLSVPHDSVSGPLADCQPWLGTIGQPSFRLYSMALTNHKHAFAIIQVAKPLSQVQHVLQDESLTFLIVTPFVLLVSILGSLWLASRAFAPIHRLASTARQIEAGDLHQRVPVPKAQDEVHFLALTLNEMIERLDLAFQRQRRFVADASHELRTPVAVIRSKAELALAQVLTIDEHNLVLRQIESEAERLGKLISNLLALARMDEGRTILETESVHLAVLAEAVVANAEISAQERGIELHLEIQEAVAIEGDETRLIQVVMNLIDNALIYTQSGGSVFLRISRKGTWAIIQVEDTGEGIAPEHLPHIFERFYRADPARTRREGGSSGLGLSIVEWTVNAHCGTISVKSKPGEGSTFTVLLPMEKI